MNRTIWTEEAEKFLPDSEIEKAFKGTNFGSSKPREIIAETLLALNGDYSSGHTATVICRELGLLGKSGDLNKKGRRYLFFAYANRPECRAPQAEVDVEALKLTKMKIENQMTHHYMKGWNDCIDHITTHYTLTRK